jgi:hypothetical protein
MSNFRFFLLSIDYIDFLAPLVFLIYYKYQRKKARGAYLWLVLFVLCAFICNCSAILTPIIQDYLGIKHNNLLAYQLGSIAYSLTLLKFFSYFNQSTFSKIIDALFIFLFAISISHDFLQFPKPVAFNSRSYGILCFWVSIKSLIYYTNKFLAPATEDILEDKQFWAISGLFLYFTCCFFIFITYGLLTKLVLQKRVNYFSLLWITQDLILAISCCFYIKSIKCKH